MKKRRVILFVAIIAMIVVMGAILLTALMFSSALKLEEKNRAENNALDTTTKMVVLRLTEQTSLWEIIRSPEFQELKSWFLKNPQKIKPAFQFMVKTGVMNGLEKVAGSMCCYQSFSHENARYFARELLTIYPFITDEVVLAWSERRDEDVLRLLQGSGLEEAMWQNRPQLNYPLSEILIIRSEENEPHPFPWLMRRLLGGGASTEVIIALAEDIAKQNSWDELASYYSR